MNKIEKLTYALQLASFNIKVFDNMIDHYCTNCDSYWVANPAQFKNIRQCPVCHEYYTYLIYFPNLGLYKIGYSSNVWKRRQVLKEASEIILVISHETEDEARLLERIWLKNIEEFKFNSLMLPTGNTETFHLPKNFFC